VSRFIRPNCALDWFTLRQLCEAATAELVLANPVDPAHGRIDLYREVDHMGRRYLVRMKITLTPAGNV
jgi:hypothetical protein